MYRGDGINPTLNRESSATAREPDWGAMSLLKPTNCDPSGWIFEIGAIFGADSESPPTDAVICRNLQSESAAPRSLLKLRAAQRPNPTC
jgi:hypothetical protein